MPRALAAAYRNPPDRATALTRPSDHGGRTVTPSRGQPTRPAPPSPPPLVPAFIQPGGHVLAPPLLHRHRQRERLPRVERGGEVAGVEGGRVDRLLQVHAEVHVVEEERQGPLVLLVAAGGAE